MNMYTDSPAPVLLYLSRSDIIKLGGENSYLYVDAIEQALMMHARREFVQPLKPYLRWAGASHIADRIIAMPAYLGGDTPIAGMKWIGSRHENYKQWGLERASGVIILNDTQTNYPIAIMEAGLISGMRTAAVTAIAARYLARAGFEQLACIGCGAIARMQLITMLEQFPSITTVSVFDVNELSARKMVQALKSLFADINFIVQTSAENAIRSSESIITCTVVDQPYIPYQWLPKGCFISNVSIMDVHKDVFLKADKVVVDDWEQCNREKKIINQLVEEGSFNREKLHAELGEIVIGKKTGRETDDEIILLNPMGMAIEDIACAQMLYKQAAAQQVGWTLPLYGAEFEAASLGNEHAVGQ